MGLAFLWLVHKTVDLFKSFLLKNLFGGGFEIRKIKDTSEEKKTLDSTAETNQIYIAVIWIFFFLSFWSQTDFMF